MASYHYNHDGVTDKCRAQDVKDCPYYKNGHFDTEQQAQAAFEASMEDQTHTHGATMFTKDIRVLRQRISELGEQARAYGPDENAERVQIYQQIGQEILDTVEQTQHVNLHHAAPIESQDTLNEISTAFHNVLQELDEHRTPDKYLLTGTQQKATKEALSVLPSELVKARNRHGAIYTKTLHGNTMTRDGVYKFRERIGTYATTPDAPESYMEPILDRLELEDKEVTSEYIDGLNIADVEAGRSAAMGYRYNAKTEAYETVFIGKPSGKDKGTRYKKLADEAVLKPLHGGEKVSLNVPIYARHTQQHSDQETIASRSAKSIGDPAMHQSVLLHEYTHSFQTSLDGHGGKYESGEAHLFHELKHGDERFSDSYGVQVYDGFPDEYMGNVSGRELLPCSVQGVLRPALRYDSQKLFEVHPDPKTDKNRRKILSWVTGYLASWATHKTT